MGQKDSMQLESELSMVDLFKEGDLAEMQHKAAVTLQTWRRSKAAKAKYKASETLQTWLRSKAAEAKAAAEAAEAEAAKAKSAAEAAKAEAAQGKKPATGAAASGLGKRKMTMARPASVGVGHVADKGSFAPRTLNKTWPAKGGG